MPDAPNQVNNSRDIDDEGGCPRQRKALHQLVDFNRDEQRCGNHCQVLGPSGFVPKANAFDHEKGRVKQGANAELLNAARTEIADLDKIGLEVRMRRSVGQGVYPSVEHVTCSRVEKLDRAEGYRDQPGRFQELEDRYHLYELISLSPVVLRSVVGQEFEIVGCRMEERGPEPNLGRRRGTGLCDDLSGEGHATGASAGDYFCLLAV